MANIATLIIDIKGKDTATATIRKTGAALKETEHFTKGVDTASGRMNATLEESAQKFKMLGLIGLGTIAALFANTPLMTAGFKMLRAALLPLFLTLQKDLMPVFKLFASGIKKINEYLMEHPTVSKFASAITALGITFAITTVFLGAFNALFLSAFGIGAGSAISGAIAKIPILNSLLTALSARFVALKVAMSFLITPLLVISALVLGIDLIFKKAFGKGLIEMIEYIIPRLWDMRSPVEALIYVLESAWILIKDIAGGISGFVGGAIGTLVGKFTRPPTFQEGGLIAKTGFVFAHAGEQLGKRGGTGGSVSNSVTISFEGANITLGGGLDLKRFGREIAEDVSKEMALQTQLRRL